REQAGLEMQLGWVDVAGTHASGVLEPLTAVTATPEACVPPLPNLLRIRDGVVTFSAPDEQAGKPARWMDRNLDLVPLAVAHKVSRPVTDRVLVTKFKRNLLEDVVHFRGT